MCDHIQLLRALFINLVKFVGLTTGVAPTFTPVSLPSSSALRFSTFWWLYMKSPPQSMGSTWFPSSASLVASCQSPSSGFYSSYPAAVRGGGRSGPVCCATCLERLLGMGHESGFAMYWPIGGNLDPADVFLGKYKEPCGCCCFSKMFSTPQERFTCGCEARNARILCVPPKWSNPPKVTKVQELLSYPKPTF